MIILNLYYFFRILSPSSEINISSPVLNNCISKLSNETKSNLGNFFSILENSPEKISSFSLDNTYLTPSLSNSMRDVEPLFSITRAQLDQIKSLENNNSFCSFDFLHNSNSHSDSFDSSHAHSILSHNESLIKLLFDKQKQRLDHDPKQEEHITASALLDSLVTACSYSQPLQLAPVNEISDTRRRLQEQIQHTL